MAKIYYFYLVVLREAIPAWNLKHDPLYLKLRLVTVDTKNPNTTTMKWIKSHLTRETLSLDQRLVAPVFGVLKQN